ncbi:MAG: hypothetical protein R3A49_07145 [Acidimicrobiia bacterium]
MNDATPPEPRSDQESRVTPDRRSAHGRDGHDPDQGGDPACWSHLFDEEAATAPSEVTESPDTGDDEAPGREHASAHDGRHRS